MWKKIIVYFEDWKWFYFWGIVIILYLGGMIYAINKTEESDRAKELACLEIVRSLENEPIETITSLTEYCLD